ncbi:carbohydrate esterase family 3 protein, partial [Myriangium duriaei CBS 260.36]
SRTLTFLPMGDSITMGYLANQSYNSYRLGMIDLLTSNTPLWNVHTVGGFFNGNFTENANEGYDGMAIIPMQEHWLANKGNYTRVPDVATILAGIHDIADNGNDTQALLAQTRLDALVDNLYRVYPNITVIISTLTPVTIDGWKGQVAAFNRALPGIVQNRAQAGQKILMVDAASVMTVDDIADFVHPTAEGYRKLANVFYGGVKSAA